MSTDRPYSPASWRSSTASYPMQSSDYICLPSHESDAVEPATVHGLPPTVRAFRDSIQQPDPHVRTIVLLLDGTGDSFDNDNSNLVHLAACLRKHEPHQQVIYYQPGIGTYSSSGLTTGLRAALDMAIGSGLGQHIRAAYRFLMKHYRTSDRICILGFSRGAYTARCLVGMLHAVGLLPASNPAQVDFAYRFYKRSTTPDGRALCAAFKRTFCTDVAIHFLGLWDCVASVGVVPRTLPFSTSPDKRVRFFRHAIALDERRAKFQVCKWLPDEQSTTHEQPTNVLEVHFLGCHADVGGGAVPNRTRHQLSRVPLRWMIRQCFACDTGMAFSASALAARGLDPRRLWPVYVPPAVPKVGPGPKAEEAFRLGTLPGLEGWAERACGGERLDESAEEWFDARAPVNDMLVLARGWWVLEAWPVTVHVLGEDGETWRARLGMNRGRRRAFRQQELKMHWTVRAMMDERRYEMRARVGTNVNWEVVA